MPTDDVEDLLSEEPVFLPDGVSVRGVFDEPLAADMATLQWLVALTGGNCQMVKLESFGDPLKGPPCQDEGPCLYVNLRRVTNARSKMVAQVFIEIGPDGNGMLKLQGTVFPISISTRYDVLALLQSLHMLPG